MHKEDGSIQTSISIDTHRQFGRKLVTMGTALPNLHDREWCRRDNNLAVSKKQKTYFDIRLRHNPYEVGDLVWLNDPAESRHKLAPHWKGPYLIQQRMDRDDKGDMDSSFSDMDMDCDLDQVKGVHADLCCIGKVLLTAFLSQHHNLGSFIHADSCKTTNRKSEILKSYGYVKYNDIIR
ncbi:hypothetical protein F2P81_019807 [Scophthalmus maximus]|uniref:Uncharacterized protein n=1 Tax=Scophthalmus maximus TaxID=52904 RepID=A0A6A4RWB3_SCOMX|nr:hypothetical protein F2P81_019807 [Scophthalmus maximus]